VSNLNTNQVTHFSQTSASISRTSSNLIAMNEKTGPIVGDGHIEDARTYESKLQQFGDGTVEHTAVFSVPLADALAKDKPSPWAGHMWKLYAIMIVVTLSTLTDSSSLGL
jgi:hypothetical protein